MTSAHNTTRHRWQPYLAEAGSAKFFTVCVDCGEERTVAPRPHRREESVVELWDTPLPREGEGGSR